MLTIERTTSIQDFSRMAQVWDDLLARSASNTIALTWDWLWTWWEVFGSDRELSILVVRDGEEIIAIAPLLGRVVQRYSILPFTRLELLASGEEEVEEICSEYLDFIIAKGREEEACRAIVRYLRDHDHEWDEILLAALPGNSPTLRLLGSNAASESLQVQPVSTDLALYLELPDNYTEFLQGLGTSLKREIRKDRRTAASKGHRFRVIDDPREFDEAFAILIKLHQSRWNSRGEPGVFGNARFRAFHELLAGRLLGRDRLKLFVLEVGGEPIAALM